MSRLTERRIQSPNREGDLIAALRDATRAEHAAIEAALRLVEPDLSLATYRRIVGRFHGYYQPIECALQRSEHLAALAVELPWLARTERLARDVVALGGPSPRELPTCDALPAIDSLAAALGCLYVLEGAALGGQVIARHVGATLGLTPERGLAFFAGDAAQIRARWTALLGILTRFGACHPTAQPEAIRAAVATFRTLRRWCEGGQS